MLACLQKQIFYVYLNNTFVFIIWVQCNVYDKIFNMYIFILNSFLVRLWRIWKKYILKSQDWNFITTLFYALHLSNKFLNIHAVETWYIIQVLNIIKGKIRINVSVATPSNYKYLKCFKRMWNINIAFWTKV